VEYGDAREAAVADRWEGAKVLGALIVLIGLAVWHFTPADPDHASITAAVQPPAPSETLEETWIRTTKGREIADPAVTAAGPESDKTVASKTESPVTPNATAWHGPRWKGARRKTKLDATFLPTREGRQQLWDALSEIEIARYLAWECNLEKIGWATSLEYHLTEILEDPGIVLGDPRPIEEIRSDYRERLGKVDRLVDPKFSDKGTMEDDKRLGLLCFGLMTTGTLKDAEDIEHRKLMRHHDQWEGAGGH